MISQMTIARIDEDIRAARANLRDLVEQEAARSGARDDDTDDELIAEQEAALARLLAQREKLTTR
jgi:hypothetical protein